MKKITTIFLCILLTFSFLTVFANEDEKLPEKTEISFRVGESTLLINGREVTVETPYIAGEGTTLVPLRVITEAFGAEVLWEGETKTITLNYPDVTIILKIGNTEVKVNDHTEKLPVPPALSPNGVTMVPLRFISETFGAEVSYKEGLITVTKSDISFGTLVSNLTDKEKIGDSYHLWVMNTPKNLILSDKSVDGSVVEFSGNDISLSIIVEDKTEDFSLEAAYVELKERFGKNIVLVDTEFKKEENGKGFFLYQCKDDTVFVDMRCHTTDKKVYLFAYYVPVSDINSHNSLISIAESFEIGEINGDFHDISEVNDGFLSYKNEMLNLSLMYPADYTIYEYAFNDIVFYSDPEDEDPYADFRLCIYSVTDKVNAKSLAEADRASRLDYSNPEFSQISELTTYTDNDTVFYKYTQEIVNTKNTDIFITDIFFEKGAYLYNICFYKEKDSDLDIDKILKSIEAEKIDAKKIGKLIRNDSDPQILYPAKNKYWSITLPSTWSADSENTSASSMFSHQYSDSTIGITATQYDTNYTSSQFASLLRSEIKDMKKKGYSDNSQITSVTINGEKLYKFTIKGVFDEETIYYTAYAIFKDNIRYDIIFATDDMSYTEKILAEAESIINTFKIEYKKDK